MLEEVLSKFWTHWKIKDGLWLFFSVIRWYVTIIFFPPLCDRCLKKQNAPLAGILFFEMHTAPLDIFLFFPLILGGYHGIKEKKVWNMFSLTAGFIGIMPPLTQPCIMWTLIQINPMSWSFNFTWCDGRLLNTPSALYQASKYYWWVVESLVRNSSVQCGWS